MVVVVVEVVVVVLIVVEGCCDGGKTTAGSILGTLNHKMYFNYGFMKNLKDWLIEYFSCLVIYGLLA